MNKTQQFTDLTAWQRGHEMVLLIYEMSKSFPKEELFGLASQMRRAAVSVTSNLAEGFSRQSLKEKIQFYYVAISSLTELQNQLIICHDTKLISTEDFKRALELSTQSAKLINALISSLKTKLP